MTAVAAAVLAAFVSYIGAWYMGAIEGNFALLLLLATVVTGAYWLAERIVFLPQRRQAARAIEDAAAQRAPMRAVFSAKVLVLVAATFAVGMFFGSTLTSLTAFAQARGGGGLFGGRRFGRGQRIVGAGTLRRAAIPGRIVRGLRDRRFAGCRIALRGNRRHHAGRR